MKFPLAVLAFDCLSLGMHVRPEHWCPLGPVGVPAHIVLAVFCVMWILRGER